MSTSTRGSARRILSSHNLHNGLESSGPIMCLRLSKALKALSHLRYNRSHDVYNLNSIAFFVVRRSSEGDK
jgi:hypothetical protein